MWFYRTKVTDGVIGRLLATGKPHYFYIPAAFRLQSARGTHTIEITVDVKFEQHSRMIWWGALFMRLDMDKAQFPKVYGICEGINHPYHIVVGDHLVQRRSEKAELKAILSDAVAHVVYLVCRAAVMRQR